MRYKGVCCGNKCHERRWEQSSRRWGYHQDNGPERNPNGCVWSYDRHKRRVQGKLLQWTSDKGALHEYRGGALFCIHLLSRNRRRLCLVATPQVNALEYLTTPKRTPERVSGFFMFVHCISWLIIRLEYKCREWSSDVWLFCPMSRGDYQ